MMPPIPISESHPRAQATSPTPSSGAARAGRRVLVAAATSALLASGFYLPHLGAGFTSEDFLILAHLSSESLATTARDELVSPWLGLESVGFWRPISTLLLAVELRVLGLEASRLHTLHCLLHALNAALLASIVVLLIRPRRAPVVAAVVAALFVIHPFHPSAVLFTGAFATLYGASFSLLAMRCFLLAALGASARGGARLGLELGALGSFALALGCYEASAVVPAVLLVTTLTVPQARGAALRVAPFFAVLGAWLVARVAVLGTPVGGYGDLRARFLTAPLERAGDLARTLPRLLHPAFGPEAGLPGALVATAVVAMAGAAVVAAIAGRSRHRATLTGPPWRCALAGLAWTALFLAPFAFVGIVPANGRYAYLAIAGVLLALGGLGAVLQARWPRAGVTAAVLALSIVAADWIALLRLNLAAHGAASNQAARVRAEVLRVAAETPTREPLLIEGHPDFVESSTGALLAKVLQYGLAESVRPPFGPLDRTVLPLPAQVAQEARAAMAAVPGAARYRWDHASSTLAPVAPSALPPPPALDILAVDAAGRFVDVACDACADTRLFVLTAALPFVAAAVSEGAGQARFAVPAAVLRGAAAQGSGPAFFWFEERGPGGLVALSAIGRVSLDGDPLDGFAEAAAKIRRGQRADGAR